MRAHASNECCAAGLPPCNPPGGTPARPPVFCKSKNGGGLGDTSPKRVRGRGPFAQRVIAFFITILITTPAMAAGSGMPWEAPLQRILESIEGPVAKVIAVVIIIVTGLSLAFGDMGGGLRRLLQIVFGLSIAFAATSFFLTFFSFAGGALID
jgi:type IV secretory pathway VirB2 component (pilin)